MIYRKFCPSRDFLPLSGTFSHESTRKPILREKSQGIAIFPGMLFTLKSKIMAKVRILSLYDSCDKCRELKTYFVYRGYYARKGGYVASHTDRYILAKSNTCLFKDNDVFSMDYTTFDTPEYFKEVVDNHIEYLIKAHGSLEKYYAEN